MDKMPELALKAGRKRQSKQTGFVHIEDRIPLLENFCFALALFRSRLSDHVLEGKALLERLLYFQAGENFPVYLHEYPHCRDFSSAQRILPALHWILTDFHPVLGEALRDRLKSAIQRIPERAPADSPHTPEAWANYLIAGQMNGSLKLEEAMSHWHPRLLTFIGPHLQDKHQPAITLYDLFMGMLFNAFSTRALVDHPLHLQAALIQPVSIEHPPAAYPDLLQLSPPHLLWGDAEHVHSLMLQAKTGLIEEKEGEWIVTLPELIPEEGEGRLELSLFCDIHPDHAIFINQKRATTFQCGDLVSLVSKGLKIECVFSGEGRFFGHLLRGNRPTQVDKGDAYDWQIALRTIKREPFSKVKISLKL